MKEFLKKLKDMLLSGVEDVLTKTVQDEFDALADELVAKAKAAIPGAIDDVVLETLKAQYKEALKQKALALIDKLDGQVG